MNVEQGWIERFEAFARSKPAGEEYCQYSARTCALAQFGYPLVTGSNCETRGVPRPAYLAAINVMPFTFGALADRLAALIPTPPEPGK